MASNIPNSPDSFASAAEELQDHDDAVSSPSTAGSSTSSAASQSSTSTATTRPSTSTAATQPTSFPDRIQESKTSKGFLMLIVNGRNHF